MKKMFLLFFLVALAPMFLMGQEVVQSFDTQLDTSYWNFESSATSDSTKSFIIQTLNEESYAEGTGSMTVEWSVHNSESWGGYTKIEYIEPGSGVMDFSAYDSISFWYNNVVAQSLPGRVVLRFELYDVSDTDPSIQIASQMEFYYSFEYVLDDEPGWHEWKMPLLDGRGDPALDEWNGGAFNRTGWSGIVGNDFLDPDKIKGYAFEFSISGAGEGDVSAGTIELDAVTLSGSKNGLTNAGFEEDLTNWGTAQADGGSYVSVVTGDAHGGEKYAEVGVTDNAWAVAWQDSVPAQAGQEWKYSSFIKDLSADDLGQSFAALKLEAHDENNGMITNFGGDQIIEGVTREWQNFSISEIMPEGTAYVTVAFVGTKWTGDGLPAKYGFDDMVLLNLGVADTTAPEAPTAVNASPNAANFFNLVVWQDVPGEVEETYNVFASLNPINSLDDPGVEEIASGVLEDQQNAIHYLIYPLKDKEVSYYYAVQCVDRAGNVGPIGTSPAISNTAEAVASISLNPPANFAADGDLSEWYDSGIMPFEFMPSVSHISAGVFDDDDDLSASVFMAIDDNYLYCAYDVFDNVWSYDPAGNFWEDDAIELYIGLYNMGTYKHTGFRRGAEPDYKFIHLADRVFSEQFGSQTDPFYFNNTTNYNYTDFGGDWAVEIMIPLDSLLQGSAADDARFHPQNGMKVPLDIAFHDSDNPNVRDGILAYSPFNNDNSYLGAENWYYTWIGDTNVVVTALEDKTNAIAKTFELKQNYPNPFNPTTTIEYSVPFTSKVKITVFNMLGQALEVLVDAKHQAGTHMINFDASKYASGVYFYQIEADHFNQTRKMLLVK
ncbi:MAG: T9SS type A sorting domain-containing protein [Calditrichaeota bacterium]|nr:T9SS type A sorting domain-containing protein [Calditrichota bacterium]